VDKAEANAVVDAMESRVRDTWYEVARREGVSERDCNIISRSFAYSGFRYQLASGQARDPVQRRAKDVGSGGEKCGHP
jgi:hypothetical protein